MLQSSVELGVRKRVRRIELLDTTLRDGSQSEGVSFSVKDKLSITKQLDEFGIQLIEGGWPGSNPKDIDFFKEVWDLELKNARIVAFGSTRRAGISVRDDANIQAIMASNVKVASIFGKTWDFHVTHALGTSLEENLSMISDTISYLKEKGLTVIYDAEHFFDGYNANAEYAIATIKAAEQAGADVSAVPAYSFFHFEAPLGHGIPAGRYKVEMQIRDNVSQQTVPIYGWFYVSKA
jgi:2-isopropylmalate synthase